MGLFFTIMNVNIITRLIYALTNGFSSTIYVWRGGSSGIKIVWIVIWLGYILLLL